jgi:threonyl-tRNA synthetase
MTPRGDRSTRHDDPDFPNTPGNVLEYLAGIFYIPNFGAPRVYRGFQGRNEDIMRVLLLHADHFSYRVTGETSITKLLDPIPEEMSRGHASEVLVCMVAVEKGDSATAALVENAVNEIVTHCEKINTKRVYIYPYAHLSSSLEAPRAADKVVKALASQIESMAGFEVHRAPFGVYKEFEIKVKGHPLSEMARTISAGAAGGVAESAALKAEAEIKSEWLVVTPDGVRHPAESFDFTAYPSLEKFRNYEFSGTRVSEEAPPHIKIMREQELVDYEPGSDQGNFRWYPKGYLLKSILEEQANLTMNRYGAMQVETPVMYSFQHPALAKYLDKFPAKQYVVRSERDEFFLRFAACFGQFLIEHDMNISYKNLPLRMYELTHHSFRREQSGEIAGLRRLRTFTMPDMHTMCSDVPHAKEEMLKQVDLCFQWLNNLGFDSSDYGIAIRVVGDFYEENQDYVDHIARMAGQPVLLEIWDKRYFYFVTKFEVNFNDTQDKSSALSTVQIDVENPETFGITYVTPDGSSAVPLMLHASVSGSIDRTVYALLEKQAMRMKEGKKGGYPFWLAPTQTRLIPVKERHIEPCKEIAGRLKGRVDIDDRNETLGKRIRDAEMEWVPLIIVVGDRELESDKLPVRFRDRGSEEKMSIEELRDYFDEHMRDKVYRPPNLPQMLSVRPVFRG